MLAERARILSQAIFFDIANTSTIFLQRVEQATSVRRKEIDAAIGEFDGAIGGVIEAIKEASGVLTDTASTMRDVTEDTQRRMKSASAASEETTEGVNQTVSATEELSGSIQEIGQQTARRLEMARSAVADTERTNKTIRSLDDAAAQTVAVMLRRLRGICTAVVITHHEAIASACDMRCEFREGRIVAAASNPGRLAANTRLRGAS